MEDYELLDLADSLTIEPRRKIEVVTSVGDLRMNTSQTTDVNYWREACKTLPGLGLPKAPPPPVPSVYLELPSASGSDSTTSREPSPVSHNSKSRRRFLPRTRDRPSPRHFDEIQLSQSVEEFRFFDLCGHRTQSASSDSADERRSPGIAPRAFSPANSQSRGVHRKLSIRRQRPMANFGCQSGDEAKRRIVLATHSGSLPSIIQVTTMTTDDVIWRPPTLVEPPLISPVLGVDPTEHTRAPSDENEDKTLNEHRESTPDLPFEHPPEPPASAPAFERANSETVFAFVERRSSLVPINEDNESPVQLALDLRNEEQRRSMIVISGNPNHDDDEPLLLSTSKAKSTTSVGLITPSTRRSTERHTIDRIETTGTQGSEFGGILHQDDAKTLQLVESNQRQPHVPTDDPPSPVRLDYSPELNERKGRIQRRKTVGPKKKTVQTRRAPVDDVLASSLFEVEEQAESTEDHSNPIVRSVSSFGFSTGEKEKKREGVISALLSVRQNKRKPSRASLHETGNIIANDRKRRSLIEGAWKHGKTSTDGLPDALAYVLSSPSENDSRNGARPTVTSEWPQLHKKKWEDLSLWNEDPANWSTQHSKVEVSASEEKRQNVIYEFYTTEKRHCQTLIFLQQFFQVGLSHHNIISESETKTLIPDVIDSLLDFHLNLLRRIQLRILAGPLVHTISDIVYEEFDRGEHRVAAVKAYTSFTLAHGDADSRFNEYMKKNTNFRLFCENLDRYPKFKERNFKACYLLITQRLTHYPTFLGRLIKCETIGELKTLSQQALCATEEFAVKVNSELSSILLNRRFDHVSSIIDRTSYGKLLGQRFTIDDLMLNGIERKIHSIGNVHWSDSQQSIELTLLLFDDVVVFLQNKNNALNFFSHKNHASVLPLSTLLIREMPRSIELMLIEPVTPDMFRLRFNNRSEMNQWMQALKAAQTMAPKYVRMTNRKLQVKNRDDQNVDRDPEVSKESEYNEKLQKWEDRLDEIFLSRMNQESKLKQYMEERMEFMDQVRSHLLAFPNSASADSNRSAPSKTREGRELSKMKTLLSSHFSDLKSFRRSELDKLVERALRFRDSDLSSFFDDLQELNRPNSSDSAALSSSSTDENPDHPSTSARCRKPRRSKTWNYGNAEGFCSKEGVRRHTTMPKMPSFVHPTIEEDYENSQMDEQLQRLPVDLNSKSRRAATQMIRENLAFRLENDRLRSENALQAMHLAAIRARKTPFAETTEKLESLRQKQEEVQTKEVAFRKNAEKKMDELKRREEELRLRENELAEREQILADDRMGFSDSANSSGLSRDTSFRGGAVILDLQSHSSSSIASSKSQTATDKVVPKHLADSKPKRRTKN